MEGRSPGSSVFSAPEMPAPPQLVQTSTILTGTAAGAASGLPAAASAHYKLVSIPSQWPSQSQKEHVTPLSKPCRTLSYLNNSHLGQPGPRNLTLLPPKSHPFSSLSPSSLRLHPTSVPLHHGLCTPVTSALEAFTRVAIGLTSSQALLRCPLPNEAFPASCYKRAVTPTYSLFCSHCLTCL